MISMEEAINDKRRLLHKAFRELEALGIPCTAQGTPEDAKKPILSLID